MCSKKRPIADPSPQLCHNGYAMESKSSGGEKGTYNIKWKKATGLKQKLYNLVSNEHGHRLDVKTSCTPMADSCQCMAKTTTIL